MTGQNSKLVRIDNDIFDELKSMYDEINPDISLTRFINNILSAGIGSYDELYDNCMNEVIGIFKTAYLDWRKDYEKDGNSRLTFLMGEFDNDEIKKLSGCESDS